MIIYIDKSVGQHLDNMPLTQEEFLFFSDLVSSHQHSHCFLCGDLASLELLAKKLNDPYSAIYKIVAGHHAQVQSIVDAVNRVLVISIDACPTLPSFIAEKCFVLALSDAIKWEIGSKCSLICENLDDCKFYTLLGKRYSYERGISGIDLSFSNTLGGGHTIATVLENCVCNNKQPALCICDSDIKYGSTIAYPQTPQKGDTIRNLQAKIQEIEKAPDHPPFDHYFPRIHEIENLIPLSILDKISIDKPDILPGLNTLKALQSTGNEESLCYYDLKDGIDIDSCKPPAKEYWSTIAQETNISIFPQLCSKLLAPALTLLEYQNSYLTIQLDEYLKALWIQVGLTVFTWGCSSRGIRA